MMVDVETIPTFTSVIKPDGNDTEKRIEYYCVLKLLSA